MEVLRVELDRDELEEKSIQEHLGVLYVKGGYTLKEGTLVCLVLHRLAVQELCAHASLTRKVVPCNNKGYHSCLEPDTRCIFISVKACARTSMSGTRQQLTDAAGESRIPRVFVWNQTPDVFLSVSKPVPGPPCPEPDNISLMRPVKEEFLVLCLVPDST